MDVAVRIAGLVRLNENRAEFIVEVEKMWLSVKVAN